MTIHKFPTDIGRDSIPFIQFSAVKYRDREFIVSKGQGSSEVTEAKPREKLRADSFYLPLPDNLTNAYSLDWEMTDLKIVSAVAEFLQSDAALLDRTSKVGQDLFAIAGGRASKLFRFTPNPKKQALFTGIQPRTFEFNYTFTPQSQKEAEIIEKIVQRMTAYSLPSLENENSSFYQFPYEFDIKFRNVKGFPSFSPCVCTNVTTNFSPVNMSILESGHATQTTLSLQFLETELLRRQKPGY